MRVVLYRLLRLRCAHIVMWCNRTELRLIQDSPLPNFALHIYLLITICTKNIGHDRKRLSVSCPNRRDRRERLDLFSTGPFSFLCTKCMKLVRPSAWPSVTTERTSITFVSRFGLMVPPFCQSSDSATDWVTGGLDFDSHQKQNIFFSSASQSGSETQRASFSVPSRGCFVEGKTTSLCEAVLSV